MANPSVCRLWRACTLLRGFNFSGIFLHHIVAWPSGNSSTKNHEDRPRDHPQESVKQEGGGQTGIKSRLAISSPDEFLVLNFWSIFSFYTQEDKIQVESRNNDTLYYRQFAEWTT